MDPEPNGLNGYENGKAGRSSISGGGAPQSGGGEGCYRQRIAYTKSPAYVLVREPIYRLAQPHARSAGAARQQKLREKEVKIGIKQCSIKTRIEAHQALKEIGKEIKSGDSKHIAEVLRRKALELDPDGNMERLAAIGSKVMVRTQLPVIGSLLRKLLAL